MMPTAGSARTITLRTHNRMLGQEKVPVVGKTGWTIAAKKCFVGAASADGRQLLVAVLGSTDLWGDLKRLIEYGLNGGDPPGSVQAWSAAPSSPAIGDAEERTAVRYFVELATVGSGNRAQSLKKSLSRRGYPARVETVRRRGRTLYRVMVGQYPTRAAAQSAAARIRKSDPHLSPTLVARN